MAQFKVTLTASSGKDRPSISVVVEATDAKAAQNYVRRAVSAGAKYVIEPVEEQSFTTNPVIPEAINRPRGTLRAAR